MLIEASQLGDYDDDKIFNFFAQALKASSKCERAPVTQQPCPKRRMDSRIALLGEVGRI